MTRTVRKYKRVPAEVESAVYDGTPKNRDVVIHWIERHRGVAFPAAELLWRPDMGCYFHKVHGFVYLPQGSRNAGYALAPLRDDELVVRTDTGIYVLVFPGDHVVRSRSGFYPLSEESFTRSYVSSTARRGTHHPVQSPTV